jgi:hypothetical protein
VLLVTLPKSDAAKPRKIAVRPALQAAEPARLEQRLAVPDDWSTSRSRGLELVVVPAALIVLSTSGRETRVERWS